MNKIVLGIDEKSKKVFNILVGLIFVLIIFIYIIANIFFKGEVIEKALLNFVLNILTIFVTLVYLYANNSKIEIENSVIIKTNLFNNKKQIGNLSEITSFCTSNHNVIVLKNNKKFFSFQNHCRNSYDEGFNKLQKNPKDNNNEFFDYLKNNCSESIFVEGNIVISLIIYLIIITVTFMLILQGFSQYSYIFVVALIWLLIYGIDENVKKFQIIADKIIYRRLFYKKELYLKDINIVKYYKNVPRGRFRPLFPTYIIRGFQNKVRIFKVNNFEPENLLFFKAIAKKYKIQFIENQ